MAYYSVVADKTSKDIVSTLFVEVGPGTSVENQGHNPATHKEVFITDAHPLWAGVQAAWPNLNATYKLNAGDTDIEAR